MVTGHHWAAAGPVLWDRTPVRPERTQAMADAPGAGREAQTPRGNWSWCSGERRNLPAQCPAHRDVLEQFVGTQTPELALKRVMPWGQKQPSVMWPASWRALQGLWGRRLAGCAFLGEPGGSGCAQEGGQCVPDAGIAAPVAVGGVGRAAGLVHFASRAGEGCAAEMRHLRPRALAGSRPPGPAPLVWPSWQGLLGPRYLLGGCAPPLSSSLAPDPMPLPPLQGPRALCPGPALPTPGSPTPDCEPRASVCPPQPTPLPHGPQVPWPSRHSRHVWLVQPLQSMHTPWDAQSDAYSSKLEHIMSEAGM